jgi:hypothetical protein
MERSVSPCGLWLLKYWPRRDCRRQASMQARWEPDLVTFLTFEGNFEGWVLNSELDILTPN